MVVVESQRYRIRSASSYSRTESVNPQVDVLSLLGNWSIMHRSFQPLINQQIECLCKTVQNVQTTTINLINSALGQVHVCFI